MGRKALETTLPPDHVAGFVDGEGCFSLNFRRDVRREIRDCPSYFMRKASFAVVLRTDDVEILKAIHSTLGCGKVSVSNDQARFHVEALEELVGIINPLFRTASPPSQEEERFLLWKQAVAVLHQHKALRKGKKNGVVAWDRKDLNAVEDIYERMRAFKSSRPRAKHIGAAQDVRWTEAVTKGSPGEVRNLDFSGSLQEPRPTPSIGSPLR